jgi:murE/murF fusion protein
MKLSSLLNALEPVSLYGASITHAGQNDDIKTSANGAARPMTCALSPDPEIDSIHYRAQDVKPGGLFVAIKGFSADGHDFIDEALKRGAAAIVSQKPVKKAPVIIEVKNTRKALASISSQFYSNPSEKLMIVGITGTNGKTTTAFLIERLLLESGIKVGVIGTLNYRYSGKTFDNPITTPESLDLQKILAEMLNHGVTHVVMEVSSHAIDLYRVYNCRLDLGVFTNLSQDHLDYHGDMESYWACKKKMFTDFVDPMPEDGRVVAVLNSNDERGKELVNYYATRTGKPAVLSVGFSENNGIRPKSFTHDLNGISGSISTPVGDFEFNSPLVGKHNLENILCATGVGVSLDLSLDSIKAGIESIDFVPGRLERIPNDSERFVYVDYAHTPDALENVLSALSVASTGRIICVFGCGGNRDKEKRPQMGQIAGRLSDLAIITSDNPRTEPPLEIIDQILQGTKIADSHAYSPSDLNTGFVKKGFVVEPDRKLAIQLAVKASRPHDTILIAGKGNETYQIIGGKTISFDDRKEAKIALSKFGAQKPKRETNNTPATEIRNPKPARPNPISWTTAEILKATGGEFLGGSLEHAFSGISIDSRRISTGDLFVAIKGDAHDGHSFVEEVIEQGVRGLLIDKTKRSQLPVKEYKNKGAVCIAVSNTTRALGELAAFNRKRSNVSVVAITGSNGKTSTRTMTAGVVSRRFYTLSTHGNLNNEIGLPLTLLNLNYNHKWAIVELGMNSPGEISRLGEICLPDVGVITNIGPAHLEGLGSLDAVMRAKGELLDKINAAGTAILNADDPRLLTLAETSSKSVLLFGMSENAAIRALSVKEKALGISFTLALPDESIPVELQTPATFMVSNALAAAAVGHCLGLNAKDIKEGLENFKPVQGRMNILKTRKGIHIIDDTYNANPGSMAAALKTITSLKGTNRGALVAGDMLELGEHSESMHRTIGSLTASLRLEKLFATGRFAETLAAAAIDGGMDSHDTFTGTQEEILKRITGWLGPGDWVLIKGSRGMAMERIVEKLLGWANA